MEDLIFGNVFESVHPGSPAYKVQSDYTSSIIAIGAASPLRVRVLMIRV